jgi:hypothetical protein
MPSRFGGVPGGQHVIGERSPEGGIGENSGPLGSGARSHREVFDLDALLGGRYKCY